MQGGRVCTQEQALMGVMTSMHDIFVVQKGNFGIQEQGTGLGGYPLSLAERNPTTRNYSFFDH